MANIRHLPRLLLITLICYLGLGQLAPSVWAAAPSGVTISPSQTIATISSDDTSSVFHITLTNHGQQPLTFNMSTVDFEGLDQSGGVLFVGQKPTQFTQRYGLANWLALDTPQLTLDPGQSTTITATITNSQTLSPGGHYGAVVATLNSTGQTSRVGVSQSVASLLFVTKQGGAEAQLQLQSLKPDRNWWGKVLATTTGFKNPGNVHVVPRGIIQVIDPANRIIARGVINADSSILLPGQRRNFDVPLLQLGWPWLPGTYQVASQYRIDGGQSLQTKIVSFRQIGILIPLVIVLVIVAAISLLLIRRARRTLRSTAPVS